MAGVSGPGCSLMTLRTMQWRSTHIQTQSSFQPVIIMACLISLRHQTTAQNFTQFLKVTKIPTRSDLWSRANCGNVLMAQLPKNKLLLILREIKSELSVKGQLFCYDRI